MTDSGGTPAGPSLPPEPIIGVCPNDPDHDVRWGWQDDIGDVMVPSCAVCDQSDRPGPLRILLSAMESQTVARADAVLWTGTVDELADAPYHGTLSRTEGDRRVSVVPWETCGSRSDIGTPCVLPDDHGIRHCGPRVTEGFRERWGVDWTTPGVAEIASRYSARWLKEAIEP